MFVFIFGVLASCFHFGRLGLFTCSVYWLIVSFGQVRFVFVLLLMSLVCAVCFWF